MSENIALGFGKRNTSNDINFSGTLSDFFSDGVKITAQEHKQMGDAPLLSNGLNILYGLSGVGKSYTSVEMAAKSGVPVKYIDLERNSQDFVNHCTKYGVEYLCIHDVWCIPRIRFEDGAAIQIIDRSMSGYEAKKQCEDELEAIESIMSIEASRDGFKGAVFILDSLSDISEDIDMTSSASAAKFMRYLHFLAIRHGITLLLIDHATALKNKDGKIIDFTIEGSKTGKAKKACLVLKFNSDRSILIEKSRNQSKLSVGKIITDYQINPGKKKKYL